MCVCMYVCMYPIAFGPPAPGPRDVGMSGCLVGWLSNPLSSGSKIGHVGSKNYEVGGENPLKSVPRGILEGSWGSQEASWRGLGGILGPRGPKSEKCSKMQRSVTPLGGQVGAQNRSKIDLEAIQKVIIFCTVF